MRITRFEGMAPQVDASRLAEGLAEDATNAAFERGALTALPLTVEERGYHELTSGQSGSLSRGEGLFYSHMANAWFAFNALVRKGVDSLIAPQDTWRRIYFADPSGVRYMTGGQYSKQAVNKSPPSYRLGIPAPASTPSASKDNETIPGSVNTEDVVYQRVAYVSTLVDAHGHEGPPSKASGGVKVPVEYPFEVTVTLSNSGNDTNGRAFGGSALKRIYRSTSGSSGTDYQFVGEVAYSSGSFTDSTAYGYEGEVLPSSTWYMPPDEIREIDAVASNFLAGFHGNILSFSEIKLPHAWPYEYRFPLKFQIVGIQSTANGLFVATTGKPYWAFGGDPQAAIPQELDYDLPCLSRNSIVDMGAVVVYASHDGLVAIDGQQAQVITEGIFTEADWKALNPVSMTAFAFEGRYFFYAPSAGVLYSLDPQAPRTLTRVSWPGHLGSALGNIATVARDERHDRTVMAVGGGGGPVLLELTHAPATEVSWVGPVERRPPRTYSFGQVLASDYPVTLTVSNERHSQTVTVPDDQLFRLPPWGKSHTWQVEVSFDSSGDDRRAVYALILARSAEELRDGP